jgi:phosphomannomutase/phosphoglucomutase
MILNPQIFRAYDIRGEAFVDFDEDGFFVIAQSFGTYIAQKHKKEKPKIFVSGDGRLSMPEMFPAIIAGLEAANCEVTWGDTLTTPINYFAFHEGDFDASIQISASHNPAKDNGLKLTDRNGAVCGVEIQAIRKLAECNDCRPTTELGICTNSCKPVDFFSDYKKKLRAITPTFKDSKKIVIDAGNGVSGLFYPEVFREFNFEVVELFCDLAPDFPNHQPDPERPENLKDLQGKVAETKSDFGFAFDGDGDRLGIVLAEGTILNADKILYVLAADFLSRNPKAKIILDAMTSATLIEKIKALGGQPILSKTGHSYIEESMHEHQALLGGEQSGHFMFGENFYGHDDAALAGLRFLQAVENDPSLIKAVTTDWPDLIEFSEKITSTDEMKFQIVEQVAAELQKTLKGTNTELNTIDGLRLDFGNGEWAIIRCSNTSPKIAIRIEAKDNKSLEAKKELILTPLQSYLNQ